MALVTGFISGFGLTSVMQYSPRILFIPSGPAIAGGNYWLISRPVPFDIDSVTGAFEADLLPSLSSVPVTTYTPRVEWLDPNAFGPDQGYIGADFPDWTFLVSSAGGPIGDMRQDPTHPLSTHIGETNDTSFPFWYQPSTALLRSNP